MFCFDDVYRFIDGCVCIISKRIKIQCLRFIVERNALFFVYIRLIGPALLGSIRARRTVNRLAGKLLTTLVKMPLRMTAVDVFINCDVLCRVLLFVDEADAFLRKRSQVDLIC